MILPILSREGLVDILRRQKIPISEWNKGEAKSIEHLFEELRHEANLVILDGKVVRRITVIGIQVFYLHPELGLLYLQEKQQIFKDGREEPVRVRHLSASVSEKLKAHEELVSYPDGVYRAIREELGIEDRSLRFSYIDTELHQPSPSASYPGLLTTRMIHTFEMIMPAKHFRIEGYIERQPDKDTEFEWVYATTIKPLAWDNMHL